MRKFISEWKKETCLKGSLLLAAMLALGLTGCQSASEKQNIDSETSVSTQEQSSESELEPVKEEVETAEEKVETAEEEAATAEEETATTEELPQSIGLVGVGNARELGGYSTEDGRKIKHGVILRTAELAPATEEDKKRLTEVYNLSVVLDLRLTQEVEAAPDPEMDGVKNLHLGIMDEKAILEKMQILDREEMKGLDLTNKMDKIKLALMLGIVSDHMYVDYLSGDPGKEGYAQMFKELQNLPEGEALLFHCTQGKDRTGVAAMLILSALGVDEDTIMSDYLLTNTYRADRIAAERKMLEEEGYEGEELENAMLCMDEVYAKCMEKALSWAKENYGSVVGYITQELGVTEDQLEALKTKYLED